MKRVIGLTGGSGSGKSLAAAVLRESGAHVIDADRVGHKQLCKPEIKDAIRRAFGDAVFDADGAVNRRALGAIVFSDADKLQTLNAITHPAITADIRAEMEASTADTVVIDAAVLEESSLGALCDRIIWIDAPEETRVARIMARDALSRDEALSRIHAQKKPRTVDAVIVNDGTPQELERSLKECLNG